MVIAALSLTCMASLFFFRACRLVNALLLLLVAAVVKRLSLFLIVACQLEHVSSYGFSTFMMIILTTVHISQ